MKKILVIGILVATVGAYSISLGGYIYTGVDYVYQGKVERIKDGDTFVCDIDLGFNLTFDDEVIRVLDLDTPETFRPKDENERTRGKSATRFATRLLDQKEITLLVYKGKERDNFGRILATVILEDGRNFAKVMKEAGHEKDNS